MTKTTNNSPIYFYSPVLNRHYLYCTQLKDDLYLLRCSETGFYHELTDGQIFELQVVENPEENIPGHKTDILRYLEDKEQVRLKSYIRSIYEGTN